MGGRLAERLKRDGHKVTALDHRYLANVDADVIYHLAAQTDLRKAEEDPRADALSNVAPMLELAKKGMKVIYAGTSTQVGWEFEGVLTEKAEDKPSSIYDLHKKMAEDYLMYYSRMKGTEGVALRFSNIYGPGPLRYEKTRGILNWAMKKAVEGKDVEIYPSSTCFRDFLYIDDAVDALVAAMSVNGKYIVCSGESITMRKALSKIPNIKTKDVLVLEPNINFRNYKQSSALFQQMSGWRPKVGLEEGIQKTMAYYRA